MKFKHFALSLTIIPIFVFGWTYPLGSEKNILMAMVNEIGVVQFLEAPHVNEITDKSLTVTGATYSNVEVYVLKNGQPFKRIKANAEGSFSFRMRLQPVDTILEFYVKDDQGKESPKTTEVVINEERPTETSMTAPLIQQLPELARGCEVTSLAMMLSYEGIDANKLDLAKELKKDPTKMQVIDGKTYFGNPHNGFVGDMYSYHNPGLGVFHRPIEELANKYMPGRIVNLTGKSFDSVLNYVAAGHPVWVITTSTFDHVPKNEWETWYTEEGPIEVTKRMHSVLVTGYDSQYIYFNDPLDGQINKKIPKENFNKGWTQYGSQAISYY